MNEWPEIYDGLDLDFNLFSSFKTLLLQATTLLTIALALGMLMSLSQEAIAGSNSLTMDSSALSSWFADGISGGFDAGGAGGF